MVSCRTILIIFRLGLVLFFLVTWHYRAVQNWSSYSHLHFPLPTSLSASSTHHLTTLFASSRFSSYTNNILPTHNHAHQLLPTFKRLLLRHFLHSVNDIPSRITIFFAAILLYTCSLPVQLPTRAQKNVINRLAYTNACQAFWAIDDFSFNSSLLSVGGMTYLIPFQRLRNALSNGISYVEIVSIFRL